MSECAELPRAWLRFQRALAARNVVLAEVSCAVECLAVSIWGLFAEDFSPEEID